MQNDLVLPISVKGILGPPGHVVLLRNERDEWELPGGRLEPGDESPPACLQREISEELDIRLPAGYREALRLHAAGPQRGRK